MSNSVEKFIMSRNIPEIGVYEGEVFCGGPIGRGQIVINVDQDKFTCLLGRDLAFAQYGTPLKRKNKVADQSEYTWTNNEQMKTLENKEVLNADGDNNTAGTAPAQKIFGMSKVVFTGVVVIASIGAIYGITRLLNWMK